MIRNIMGSKSFLKGEVRTRDKKKKKGTSSAQCPLCEESVFTHLFNVHSYSGKACYKHFTDQKTKAKGELGEGNSTELQSRGLSCSVIGNFKCQLD